MISKKKKDLHRNSKGFSGRNHKFKGFFLAEIRWSPKKKVFTDFGWEPKNSTILVLTMASPSQLRLPNPFGGSCFHFWSKNRPQKHKKTRYFAYLSDQWGEGGLEPPPASPLAPLLSVQFIYFYQAHSQKFAMGRAVPGLMAKELQNKKEYIWIWNNYSIKIQVKIIQKKSSPKIGAFFLTKFGWRQKKEGLRLKLSRFQYSNTLRDQMQKIMFVT